MNEKSNLEKIIHSIINRMTTLESSKWNNTTISKRPAGEWSMERLTPTILIIKGGAAVVVAEAGHKEAVAELALEAAQEDPLAEPV